MNNKQKIILILSLVMGVICAHAQRFDRGIDQHTFVPKGQWTLGSSISYSEYSFDNYKFLIIEGINGSGYSFKISPVLCYTFKDNMAAGGRFRYNRSLNRINSADVKIDDDLNFNVDNLYVLSHSYSGIAILRNYISLGSSTRFGLYNEIQLTLGGGQSKLVNGKGDSLTGTFETSFDAQIGMSPGLIAFINNFTAVEVSVGVLGFNYSKVRQVTDQVQFGERNSSSANFRINLFSIGLGIAFYL